jgi:hypothetical protein
MTENHPAAVVAEAVAMVHVAWVISLVVTVLVVVADPMAAMQVVVTAEAAAVVVVVGISNKINR